LWNIGGYWERGPFSWVICLTATGDWVTSRPTKIRATFEYTGAPKGNEPQLIVANNVSGNPPYILVAQNQISETVNDIAYVDDGNIAILYFSVDPSIYPRLSKIEVAP